jgi:hypothetical protein
VRSVTEPAAARGRPGSPNARRPAAREGAEPPTYAMHDDPHEYVPRGPTGGAGSTAMKGDGGLRSSVGKPDAAADARATGQPPHYFRRPAGLLSLSVAPVAASGGWGDFSALARHRHPLGPRLSHHPGTPEHGHPPDLPPAPGRGRLRPGLRHLRPAPATDPQPTDTPADPLLPRTARARDLTRDRPALLREDGGVFRAIADPASGALPRHHVLRPPAPPSPQRR